MPRKPSPGRLHVEGQLLGLHEYDHGDPLSGAWTSWVLELRGSVFLHIGEMDVVSGPFKAFEQVLNETEFGYITSSSTVIKLPAAEHISLLKLDYAEVGQEVFINGRPFRVGNGGVNAVLIPAGA
jgi:hypothetical protein